MASIIKLYEDFKKMLGDEKEMKKYLPIFEKEIDTTIKLIKLKQSQVLDPVQIQEQQMEAPVTEQEYLPPEEGEEVPPEEGEVNFPGQEEEEAKDVPPKPDDITQEEWDEAVKNVPSHYNAGVYKVDLEKYVYRKREGK